MFSSIQCATVSNQDKMTNEKRPCSAETRGRGILVILVTNTGPQHRVVLERRLDFFTTSLTEVTKKSGLRSIKVEVSGVTARSEGKRRCRTVYKSSNRDVPMDNGRRQYPKKVDGTVAAIWKASRQMPVRRSFLLCQPCAMPYCSASNHAQTRSSNRHRVWS